MSAIAGLVRWDGGPADAAALSRMIAAMARRAPDGTAQWQAGAAALGHGALRTTPESLCETQPLSDPSGNCVLVLDGLLDNRQEVRSALRRLGFEPRDDSDAELVLLSYAAWGEACPGRLVGEFAFFVWDAARRTLFGARDAVGCRFFHYHAGSERFAFASDIRGLLAEGTLVPRLNPDRLLDYLSDEFDREDEVGTFYRDIVRLPAGHAMRVTAEGTRTWRYWHPENLSPLRFRSTADGVATYLDLFRQAVRCRLRSRGPVGALLSGGLDSSSIVALIGREFREEMPARLRTFTLDPGIADDPEARGRREILADPWYDATMLTTGTALEHAPDYGALLREADEPFFLSQGFANLLLADAAASAGCAILMDGMASDLYYFAPSRSLSRMLRDKRPDLLPGLLSGVARQGSRRDWAGLGWTVLQWLAPEPLRVAYRRRRDSHGGISDALQVVRPEIARDHLARRRRERALRVHAFTGGNEGTLALHAADFASGMLCFAHEVGCTGMLARGIEPRSPYSDRRLVEFAIALPIDAKIAGPWQKNLLREAMAGILPESLRWETAQAGYPGSLFLSRYLSGGARIYERLAHLEARLGGWVDPQALATLAHTAKTPGPESHDPVYLNKVLILADWLDGHSLDLPR